MRKKLKTLAVGIVFAATLLFAPVVKADAAGMTQTNLAADSITFQWEPQAGALQYNIYVGTNYSDATLYASVGAGQTTATISGLPAGSERYVNVKYEKLNYRNEKVEYYVATDTFKTLPGKVTGVRQSKWWYFIEDFSATWDNMEAADKYEYIIRTSGGKKVKEGDAYSNSASCSTASNKKIYTVQVRAVETINGQTYYGEWSDKAYCFTQPRITYIKGTGNKISLKWNKVDGATGYDIYVSTKPKTGYKKVKSVKKNTNSVTITKIGKSKVSSKKKYYVYIATVKKVGKTKYDSGRLYYWNTKSGSNHFDYF